MKCNKCLKENFYFNMQDGLCLSCYKESLVAFADYQYKCVCGGEFNVPEYHPHGTAPYHCCPFCGKIMLGLI